MDINPECINGAFTASDSSSGDEQEGKVYLNQMEIKCAVQVLSFTFPRCISPRASLANQSYICRCIISFWHVRKWCLIGVRSQQVRWIPPDVVVTGITSVLFLLIFLIGITALMWLFVNAFNAFDTKKHACKLSDACVAHGHIHYIWTFTFFVGRVVLKCSSRAVLTSSFPTSLCAMYGLLLFLFMRVCGWGWVAYLCPGGLTCAFCLSAVVDFLMLVVGGCRYYVTGALLLIYALESTVITFKRKTIVAMLRARPCICNMK